MEDVSNVAKTSYTSGERAFTRREFELLLAHTNTYEDKLLFSLAVATGMRREDIVRVELVNIYPTEGKILYHERKKKRIKEVYISPNLMLIIVQHTGILPKGQKKLFGFSGRTAYTHLQDACLRAGIPPRPFHALRATCVKFCQTAGWSPEETAKHIGDTIRTVQEHYSTPSDAEMREASSRKSII